MGIGWSVHMGICTMGLKSAAHMICKRLLLIEPPTGRQIFVCEQQGWRQAEQKALCSDVRVGERVCDVQGGHQLLGRGSRVVHEIQ